MGVSAVPGARVSAVRGLLLVAWLVALPAGASAQQQTHLLVIVGLGGDPAFTEQFHGWATTLINAAATRYEVPTDNITYLGEDPDLDPATVTARSTRKNVGAAVDAIAARAAPGDQIVIVFFGHGSFTDAARVNLPGRDLSADDFAELLERLRGRRVAFINTASASGPFVEKLSGADRTVVTATRSGGEQNASVFGGFFVEAFAEGEDDADANKDRRVSVLEAFTYARLKVEQAYEAEGKLLTEHALLDDNGDGEGTAEPDPLTGDGMIARTLFLTSGESTALAEMAFPDDPELRPLYDERASIEERVEALRVLKDGTDPERYEQELETLLVELALKGREIRQLEAARGAPRPR